MEFANSGRNVQRTTVYSYNMHYNFLKTLPVYTVHTVLCQYLTNLQH